MKALLQARRDRHVLLGNHPGRAARGRHPGPRARVNGVDVDLTKREFDLLAVLAEHKTAVLSRAQLLELVWGLRLRRRHQRRRRVHRLSAPEAGGGGAPRLLHTVRVWASCCARNEMTLSRIFRRTPSLRTRVAFATAIGRRSSSRSSGPSSGSASPTTASSAWTAGSTRRRVRGSVRAARAGPDPAVAQRPERGDHGPPRRPGSVQLPVVLPKLDADYATTDVDGVRYRVRTVEIPYAAEPTTLGRRHLRRHHRRHQQPASPGAGDLRVRGRRRGPARLAAGRSRSGRSAGWPSRPGRSRPGDEAPTWRWAVPPRPSRSARRLGVCSSGSGRQDRTKAALASARDFAAVSAHELRTPLTAMRTNLEVLTTLDLPDDQRSEVLGDVIRTQSRIEATLGALERLAQGDSRRRPIRCRSTSPNCSTGPPMTRCGCIRTSRCPWCPADASSSGCPPGSG